MLLDISTFESDYLWALVVVIILTSLAVYAPIGVAEVFVLARYGPAPTRSWPRAQARTGGRPGRSASAADAVR